MFIDRITVECRAGKGGNGIVSWQREKFIPKGGPGGGNGGRGGSIIIEADTNEASLEAFCNRRIIKAENGKSGGPRCMQGGAGEDLIIKVPCGTLIRDALTGEVLFDLVDKGERFVLCAGGKGGKGNFFFRSPTNQTPNFATPGEVGQIKEVELELKLIADIGLVGFPNAGKSTLFSALCHFEVKTALYPFTTIHPNIGQYETLCIADIPGIIEGAHANKGLGLAFLRHIERTKLLVFVLDASISPVADFRVLQQELQLYNPELQQKPFLVALNKCDLCESQEQIVEFTKVFPELAPKTYVISASTGIDLEALGQTFKQFV